MVPGALAPRLLAFAFVLLTGLASHAGELHGRVVGIQDGDSITVLLERTPKKVRIFGIDAPERAQPWSARAKRALSDRVHGETVRLVQRDVDRYGRIVAEVFVGDVCVACEMVRGGHAWVYRRYTRDPRLLALEDEAREGRVGLWGLPEYDRVAPWSWRAAQRAGAEPRPARRSDTCGAKRYCREMTSCDEAYFHLETCGLTRLDGDGDGVPCEKLCRSR